jgi:hypothetical protein
MDETNRAFFPVDRVGQRRASVRTITPERAAREQALALEGHRHRTLWIANAEISDRLARLVQGFIE